MKDCHPCTSIICCLARPLRQLTCGSIEHFYSQPRVRDGRGSLWVLRRCLLESWSNLLDFRMKTVESWFLLWFGSLYRPIEGQRARRTSRSIRMEVPKRYRGASSGRSRMTPLRLVKTTWRPLPVPQRLDAAVRHESKRLEGVKRPKRRLGTPNVGASGIPRPVFKVDAENENDFRGTRLLSSRHKLRDGGLTQGNVN